MSGSASRRVMVDMSATLIHHGHIRLIQKASEHGSVVVGLTTDKEIRAHKGYVPELNFSARKEILEAINGVDEVVATPWLINDQILDYYDIDLLVHGDDNSNQIRKNRLLVLPRTEGVSSTDMRSRAMRSIGEINNKKLMLTPGPAVILHENLIGLKPVFGRGDKDYQDSLSSVEGWIKKLSGQDELVTIQGSATLALEIAAKSFVSGKVLIVDTGYYSSRLTRLVSKNCQVTKVNYDELFSVREEYDWVLCAYTETSHAFKVDLLRVRNTTDRLGAKLFVDATGSIGLEDHHELCDVCAFSSCKGLFGLTGAGFIAYKKQLTYRLPESFYLNLDTHRQHSVTGPYHAIASLLNVMPIHDELCQRVKSSKSTVMEKFSKFIQTTQHQPLLCTYLDGKIEKKDNDVVLYSPRSNLPGSIVCHLGEVHQKEILLHEKINVLKIEKIHHEEHLERCLAS